MTKKPRRTTLEILCHADSKYNSIIEDVAEVSTCEYHVKLRTPLLCANPLFMDVSSLATENSQLDAKTISCSPFEPVEDEDNIFLSDTGLVLTKTHQDDISSGETMDEGDIAMVEIDLLSAVEQLLEGDSNGASSDD